MAVIALTIMPVGGYLLGRLIRRVRKAARRSYDGSARILETMQETVLGIRIVKSFNLEGIMRKRMSDSVREVERSVNSMAAGMAVSSPISDAVAGIAIGAVIFYGSYRVSIAGADAGSFFSFIAALLLAYEPGKRLARLNLDIQHGLDRRAADLRSARHARHRGPAAEPAATRRARRPHRVRECALRISRQRICSRRPRPRRERRMRRRRSSDPRAAARSTIIAMIQRFYAPGEGRDLDRRAGHRGRRSRVAARQNRLRVRRTSICSAARSATTSRSAVRARAMQKSWTRPARRNAHDFIMGFRTAMTPTSASRARNCPAGNASASPSRAPS